MRSSGSWRRRATTLLAVVLTSALPAYAQDSSTSSPPANDDRPWWAPVSRAHTWLTDRGIYPDAGIIVAGSSLAFGGQFRDLHIADSPIGLEVGGMWSVRGYQEYTLRVGLIDRLNETFALQAADSKISSQFNDLKARLPGWAVYGEFIERDYPQMNFYGIGRDASLDGKADYAVRGHSADLIVQYRTNSDLAASARVGVLELEIGRGTNADVPDLQDRYPAESLPGLTTQPRYVTVGLAAARDNRDSPLVPTTGSMVAAALWWLAPTDDTAFTSVRLTLDARTFLTPGNDRGVLALRAVLSSDLSDDPTPFYLLPHLGGSDALRGYPSYLFREDMVGLLSVEYRWRVRTPIDIVPFMDVGATGTTLRRLGAEILEVTPGIGIRLRNDDRVWGRMDVGYRPGAIRFSFSLGPPF